MNHGDKNILDTLNLLALLLRARIQNNSALTEEQQHTLSVTQEHLTKAQISVPLFLNTLQTLGDKGYLIAVSTFEDDFRKQIGEALTEENFDKLLTEVERTDTGAVVQKIQEVARAYIDKIAPSNFKPDWSAEPLEEMTFASMLSDGREAMVNSSPDTVSTVIILPFRSIERLLEKINSGMSFNEVQDAGIWYDASKYEFHFHEQVLNTANRGTPTTAHFILDALFSKTDETVIDYADVAEFDADRDSVKENKKHADAMRHFVSKHSVVYDVFKIYSDRVEIVEPYRVEIH